MRPPCRGPTSSAPRSTTCATCARATSSAWSTKCVRTTAATPAPAACWRWPIRHWVSATARSRRWTATRWWWCCAACSRWRAATSRTCWKNCVATAWPARCWRSARIRISVPKTNTPSPCRHWMTRGWRRCGWALRSCSRCNARPRWA
ncbi:hypothetical protein G6F46_014841 [Rhizopus delemar]|nr:hypothetical protein G6F46_014841 [Rhizopus delemar]